jgi:D-glycero-alpha-D-manno-heptose 1-phosphate guanylyltransferase
MDNPIKEAIVLAGGQGTRLRSEIGELPKALAPVNGQPFIHFLLRYLKKNGIETVILSVGYKHELIAEALGDTFEGLKLIYAIEKQPLGTGGGIKLALEKTKTDILYVCNGDTFFDVDLKALSDFHFAKQSNCTIALKELENVDRYGNIETDDTGKVTAFLEKQPRAEATVNGGVYCINRGLLIHYPVNTPFSLETNYLENNPKAKKIYGKRFDAYFKDIGVPEDYHQFQKDVSK